MNILQIDDELSFFASCPKHSKRAPNRFRLLRRIEVLRFTWDELGWFIVASCENVPARTQADSSIRQNSNCSIWQKIISSEVGDKPNNFSAYAQQDVSTAKRWQHSGTFHSEIAPRPTCECFSLFIITFAQMPLFLHWTWFPRVLFRVVNWNLLTRWSVHAPNRLKF